jgi:hypothetical protein
MSPRQGRRECNKLSVSPGKALTKADNVNSDGSVRRSVGTTNVTTINVTTNVTCMIQETRFFLTTVQAEKSYPKLHLLTALSCSVKLQEEQQVLEAVRSTIYQT